MRRFLTILVAGGLTVACWAERVRPENDPPYDPKANAVEDVRKAVEQAAAEGKNVLVDVGGEWCPWCHYMDTFFVEHPELLKLRKKNFVFVKVNFSEENENKEFFSMYPKVTGYPHIFILDGKGKLLHSQNTAELEAGKSYDLKKLTAFLTRWGPG